MILKSAFSRSMLRTRAGVLSSALDAAVSGAREELDREDAVPSNGRFHMAGMEMLVRIEKSPSLHEFPPVEIARMTSHSAALEVYQSACVTLLKLKARVRQQVVVE